MMKYISLIVLVLTVAARGADTIHVGGAVSQPADWTVDQLRTQFAADLKAVTYTSKDGTSHTSNCVPLMDILKSAGVPMPAKSGAEPDARHKNPFLHFAVAVQGRDGYMVLFSLAELMPEFGNKDAWVALDEDGSALSGRDEPVKLIVPSDVKAGRWVRGVSAISVMDDGPPATQP